jgi:hypothetical protein
MTTKSFSNESIGHTSERNLHDNMSTSTWISANFGNANFGAPDHNLGAAKVNLSAG